MSPLKQAIAMKRLELVKLLLVKGEELERDTLRDAIIKENKWVSSFLSSLNCLICCCFSRKLTHILVRHAINIAALLNDPIPKPSYTGALDRKRRKSRKSIRINVDSGEAEVKSSVRDGSDKEEMIGKPDNKRKNSEQGEDSDIEMTTLFRELIVHMPGKSSNLR